MRAGDVAETLGVPANYLSKILHKLGRTDLLLSERGPGGGFRLAHPPSSITLADIVGPFEDYGQERRCLLSEADCTDSQPCAAHAGWKELSERTHDFFRNTTVADLLESGSPALDTVPRRGDADGT